MPGNTKVVLNPLSMHGGCNTGWYLSMAAKFTVSKIVLKETCYLFNIRYI